LLKPENAVAIKAVYGSCGLVFNEVRGLIYFVIPTVR